MSDILGVVEWFRPFVQTKIWDYVVVWKYGNDPTRFIEWMGCCCCGGNVEKVKLEEEMGEQFYLAPICRDTLFHHPVRTRSCEALAKLPFAMSLYSCIHAEVAMSQQPRWLIHEDSIGTQVLIPVIGGLVELFTAKHIQEDISIMEFISSHCCVSRKQEVIYTQSYTNMNFNENIEGPSSGSLFDSQFGCLNPHEHLKQPVKISPIPIVKSHIDSKISTKDWSSFSFHCGNNEEENKEKIVTGPKKEVYHAKNLITERNRRKRMKKGLFTLRSLVPNITKMDIAAILEDAIDYIRELQRQETELQKEVKDLEVEDCEKNTLQIRVQEDKEQEEGNKTLPPTKLNRSSSDSSRKTQMEMQVEVNHVGGSDFMIKVCCEQKQGGFSRLMEAIHSFGLNVVNANMTTFDGKVLNIIMVEATSQNIHLAKLKEYLIQQTSGL